MKPRARPLFAAAAILVVGTSLWADDPPDRLEKKPRPAEQKPADRPPAKADDKPVDEPETKDDAARDAAKLREEIAKDMQSAEKKLKERDPGRDTQQLQDRVIRNIDKLLDLARNPPPSPPPMQQQQPMGGDQRPMGGDQRPMEGQQPQGGERPKSGSQSQPGPQQQPQGGQARRERRALRRQQMEQQTRGGQKPQQQPGGKGPGGEGLSATPAQEPGTGGRDAKAPPDKLADVVKDIWGHLPETLRQDVDHYYRDRFMPRYRDLLQEYYSRLAERDRNRREARP